MSTGFPPVHGCFPVNPPRRGTAGKIGEGVSVDVTGTLAVLIVYFLPSCAPKIRSVYGSHDLVQVNLTQKKKKRHYLKTVDGKTLARAYPSSSKKLRFNIPTDGSVNPALLAVYNHKGKRLTFRKSQMTTFRNKSWEAYNDIKTDYLFTSGTVSNFKFLNQKLTTRLNEASNNLSRNQAYSNGKCVKPRVGTLPRKPVTACSPGESKKVGAARVAK